MDYFAYENGFYVRPFVCVFDFHRFHDVMCILCAATNQCVKSETSEVAAPRKTHSRFTCKFRILFFFVRFVPFRSTQNASSKSRRQNLVRINFAFESQRSHIRVESK